MYLKVESRCSKNSFKVKDLDRGKQIYDKDTHDQAEVLPSQILCYNNNVNAQREEGD